MRTTAGSTQSNYCLFLPMLMRAKHGLIALAEARGLTAMQVHALCFLTPTEPMSMRGLAKMLGCDASNITGIVDRLESRGLIARTEDPRDRRVKIIALTEAGVATREAMLGEISRGLEEAVQAAMTPEEQATFYQLLLKLRSHHSAA